MASTEQKTDRKARIINALHAAREVLGVVYDYVGNAIRNEALLEDEEVQSALSNRQLASGVAAVVEDLLSIMNAVGNAWRRRDFASVAGYSPDGVDGKAAVARNLGIRNMPYIPRETGQGASEDDDGEDGDASEVTRVLACARERLEAAAAEAAAKAKSAKAAKSAK